jgi:hypothetical protein
MYDEKINKILGTGPVIKNPLRPEHTKTNFNVDPNRVLQQIKGLLDRLPEVKKAQGNIVIELSDGKKTTLNIQYRS